MFPIACFPLGRTFHSLVLEADIRRKQTEECHLKLVRRPTQTPVCESMSIEYSFFGVVSSSLTIMRSDFCLWDVLCVALWFRPQMDKAKSKSQPVSWCFSCSSHWEPSVVMMFYAHQRSRSEKEQVSYTPQTCLRVTMKKRSRSHNML